MEKREYKEKIKRNKDNRNTREHSFILGDYVLLKQQKRNQWTTAYEPNFYQIYRIDGSSIGTRRIMDGREVYRDASRFKLAYSVVDNEEGAVGSRDSVENDDWRHDLLKEGAPDNSKNEENYDDRRHHLLRNFEQKNFETENNEGYEKKEYMMHTSTEGHNSTRDNTK